MIYMKTITSILFIIFFLSTSLVFSQNQERIEEEILNSYLSQPDGSIFNIGNQTIITQVGDANYGNIEQTAASIGLGNYGDIYQKGNFNAAILYQYGNQIGTSISQTGGHNYADIDLTGYNINGEITQDGFHNSIDQTLSGHDFDYFIHQDGNNNLFIQNETNITTGFGITQNGDGIITIIE